MSGLRPPHLRSCAVLGLMLGLGSAAVAQPAVEPRGRSVGDVEATASVTLNGLSVRTLRADKPWNPRVCIGCELNNAPAPGRRIADHVR